MCAKGKKLGVPEGSSLTLAKAFLPHATVKEFDPLKDFKTIYRLSIWSYTFSPLIGLDPELISAYTESTLHQIKNHYYGINIDITGTERVHKGEYALINRIIQKLQKARFEAKIAVGPTLGAAWAFSRYAPEKISISYSPSLKESLSALPIEALRISHQTTTLLRQVGVKDIATLLSIPRRSLLERYGKECLLRIDQALGVVPERVVVIPPPHRWMVWREFEVPLEKQTSLVSCVATLLEELVLKIREKKRKAKSFIVLFEGEDEQRISFREIKEFSFFTASKSSSHVVSVISPLIEALKIPGPVYFIALTSKDTVPDTPRQSDFSGESDDDFKGEELLNYFVAHLGRENVSRMEFSNSYIPELSYSLQPIDAQQATSEAPCWIQERPSYLLPELEEVSALAMLPDNPPVRLTWKGQELTIVKGLGPERIANEWWNTSQPEISSRDYFKVQDHTGRWLWVFRDTQSFKWYIQGLWI